MMERKIAMPISIEEAVKLVRDHIKPLLPVRTPLFEALGCITAEEIIAHMDQPPFPRSPIRRIRFESRGYTQCLA